MIRHAVRQATTYVAVIGDAKQAACRLLRRPCETEFRALPLLVEPGSHCIDVGANRGQSIEALHLYGQTRITALEPQARLAERLTRRFPTVRVIQAGAGERHEQLTLHTPVYRGYAFDGLASVKSEGIDDWLRHSLWRFDEHKFSVRMERIEIVPLDSLALGDVGFVKLDVQGAELATLRGARELLRQQPVLMVETPDDEIDAFLAALGYRPWSWSGDRLVRGRHALNVFFIAS